MDSDVITEVPQSFVDEFRDHIMGTLPMEKAQAELRQAGIQRVMQSVGSLSVPGLGQKVAEIDARLYFRLLHHANDPTGEWLTDYLVDNPSLCAPGYRPKRKSDFRHGHTFINGKPVR